MFITHKSTSSPNHCRCRFSIFFLTTWTLLLPRDVRRFQKLSTMLSSLSFLVKNDRDWKYSFIFVSVYIVFEIAWLVTGTVWLIGVDPSPEKCDKTIHVFSMVVVINFWIHILTPLLFMLCLCCTKVFPFLGHCTYWNIMKVILVL